MSNPRSDGTLLLAVCIATAAVLATVMQSFQIVRDFDLDTTSNLMIIGGTFSQVSLAMAMVCAVIIGRQMVAPRATGQQSDSATADLNDQITDDV